MLAVEPNASLSDLGRRLRLGAFVVRREYRAMEQVGCLSGTCSDDTAIHCVECAYGPMAHAIDALARGETVFDLAARLKVTRPVIRTTYIGAKRRGCLDWPLRSSRPPMPVPETKPYVPPPSPVAVPKPRPPPVGVNAPRLSPPIGSCAVEAR